MHTVLSRRPYSVALRPLAQECHASFARGYASASTAAAPVSLPRSVDHHFTFTDHLAVYEHQGTEDLCRSLLVLHLCSFAPFVQHSERLLRTANRPNTTAAAAAATAHPHPAPPPHWLREAVYRHFCVGDAPADVWARMNALRAHGVGTILDCAEQPAAAQDIDIRELPARSGSKSWVEDAGAEAEAEADCDRRLTTLLRSVDTAAVLPGTGFAAVRLSTLGAPSLLVDLAEALRQELSPSGTPGTDGAGSTSAEAFSASLHRLARVQATPGADPMSAPSWLASRQQQLEAFQGRLDQLVERAVTKGVKLLLEAEQDAHVSPDLHPALEHLAHHLMRRHNCTASESPGAAASVFLTYPAHLASTAKQLAADLARAEREGFTLGAKLVSDACGDAYDDAYDACLDLALSAVQRGRAEVMVGAHSAAGVGAAVGHMSRLGLDPEEAPVFFSQLLGLADPLTFTLGSHGYKVYKYCPFGDVDKVTPYLVRRIQQAQSVLQGGGFQDLRLGRAELWRRLLHQPTAELMAQVAELLAPVRQRPAGV